MKEIRNQRESLSKPFPARVDLGLSDNFLSDSSLDFPCACRFGAGENKEKTRKNRKETGNGKHEKK